MSSKNLIAAAAALMLLGTASAVLAGKPSSGGSTTLCQAQLQQLSSGGWVLRLATNDGKVSRVDIYDDAGNLVRSVPLSGGSALIVADFIVAGEPYHAEFIQAARRGDIVRCVADFGLPPTGGGGGGGTGGLTADDASDLPREDGAVVLTD